MKMGSIAGKVVLNRFTVSLTLGFVLLISGTVAFNINRKSSFRAASGSPVVTGVGDAPVSVTMGDFNKDGILDLAIANSTDNSVSILLGKGDGTFAPSAGSAISTGGNLTTGVAVGDFNNDGKLDMVATDLPGGLSGGLGDIFGSPGGNISVFLGNGDGTFGGHKDTDGGGDFPGAVAVGDFNGDGKLDVVITNFANQDISVQLGHGDGSFSQAINSPIHIGHRPAAVVVGDFNLDGKQDIAVANAEDNDVVILMGKGDGSFAAASNSPITVGRRPVALAIADFNGDGKPDLAVANLLSSNVQIFAGDGAGAFQLIKELPTGRYPCSLAVGDFDSDGKADLAVVNQLSEMVSVFLGDGAGSFSRSRNFPLEGHPQSIVAGDFNKDGQLDLAIGNVATKSVSVLLNNTDITPPVLTMPVLSDSYLLNSSVTFSFGAVDSQSGVASLSATLNGAPITSGTTVALNHLGLNTFTLSATDGNFNTATQSAIFTVLYNFGGFLPPIPKDNTGVFSKGGTLPVAFQLSDVNGTQITTAVANLTVQQVSGSVLVGVPVDAIAPGNSDTGNLFRFDGQKYIYNLSTKPLASGTWQVQVRLDDGTVHSVLIGVK
ncbi:MAG TPA: FG-GAP-like repeat-containing protein [Candidatus Limnocylindrales bacterium]|nr:FG-GAP-like repeat-containing protein [Candidatus Limnocylindrales bacterium]